MRWRTPTFSLSTEPGSRRACSTSSTTSRTRAPRSCAFADHVDLLEFGTADEHDHDDDDNDDNDDNRVDDHGDADHQFWTDPSRVAAALT